MGLGYALMEEVLLEEGVIQNPRFSEYLIPTSLDIPNVISLTVEKEEPTGPFGAKGVGEPALLPTVPAILNAIRSATGIRFKEIPVTSEKVWELLRERRPDSESEDSKHLFRRRRKSDGADYEKCLRGNWK